MSRYTYAFMNTFRPIQSAPIFDHVSLGSIPLVRPRRLLVLGGDIRLVSVVVPVRERFLFA